MDEYIAAKIHSVRVIYKIFPEYFESFESLNLPIKATCEFIDTFGHIYPLYPEIMMKIYKVICFDTFRNLAFSPAMTDARTIYALKSRIPELYNAIETGERIFYIAEVNTIDDLNIIYNGITPEKNVLCENMAELPDSHIASVKKTKIKWICGRFKVPDRIRNIEMQ